MKNPFRRRAAPRKPDLHPLDEALTFRTLIDSGEDRTALAKTLGISEAYIYQRIRLLDLVKQAQDEFRSGLLGKSQAFEIAQLEEDEQLKALKVVRSKKMSIRQFRVKLRSL